MASTLYKTPHLTGGATCGPPLFHQVPTTVSITGRFSLLYFSEMTLQITRMSALWLMSLEKARSVD